MSHAVVAATPVVVYVDVIIPVHNASETIVETVASAMGQEVPETLRRKDTLIRDASSHSSSPSRQHQRSLGNYHIDIAVCCYDDGSTDQSAKLLADLEARYSASVYVGCFDACDDQNSIARQVEEAVGCNESIKQKGGTIATRFLVSSSDDGVARGAGYARNRAANLRPPLSYGKQVSEGDDYFLCLLDSDDTMHPHRVAEQLSFMLALSDEPKTGLNRTLLGCNFSRVPADSTWHYTNWANNLTNERLMLERYREVTILQPTWMLSKRRFLELGGYIEAPHPKEIETPTPKNLGAKKISTPASVRTSEREETTPYRLIHPTFDTPQSLRLAEDLRFFHAHLRSGGVLKLLRTPEKPLVCYRHRAGMSQSSSTPRKLLLHLRVKAFEDAILRKDRRWSEGFSIWGAGRDGKDFFKALSPDLRSRVKVFVDVDKKKISSGYYHNRETGSKVPIIHFSLLCRNDKVREELEVEWDAFQAGDSATSTASNGRIIKSKCSEGVGDNQIKQSLHSSQPLPKSAHNGIDTECKMKSKHDLSLGERPAKRRKVLSLSQDAATKQLNLDGLKDLPVVVCVAMYRTGGVLESNVSKIGRTEGIDLWHFS